MTVWRSKFVTPNSICGCRSMRAMTQLVGVSSPFSLRTGRLLGDMRNILSTLTDLKIDLCSRRWRGSELGGSDYQWRDNADLLTARSTSEARAGGKSPLKDEGMMRAIPTPRG